MKNLLVYTNPIKKFDEESDLLVKIQIDNSFDLGWKKEDIFLAANFEYEYKGVKSTVVGDLYDKNDKTSNKIPVIGELFNRGIIEEKELYWYHDIDAYQNYAIEEPELGLDNFDLGLTTYGYKVHWNCGCFFFKNSAKDIFDLLNQKLIERKKRTRADEKALKYLTDHNMIDEQRYKIMNTAYNFQYLYTNVCYSISTKPIKVLHFHPFWTTAQDYRIPNTLLDIFMYGKNGLDVPLMSDRLINIFNSYGIK